MTDMHCRAAQPRERLYRMHNRDGLYLEAKPNGAKAFRYRFKLGSGVWPAAALKGTLSGAPSTTLETSLPCRVTRTVCGHMPSFHRKSSICWVVLGALRREIKPMPGQLRLV